MKDGDFSKNTMARELSGTIDAKNSIRPFDNDNASKLLYHSHNIFSSDEIRQNIFSSRFRFGLFNSFDNVNTVREYLFFTKPDLNIVDKDSGSLNPGLAAYPFWTELYSEYPEVISMLQSSFTQISIIKDDPFNQLLGNTVQSNLDMPSISAELIDTPSNMYGVNYKYRGSSEASDDGHSFSLEFKDLKSLPVYKFFKAYDQYEILKHHGVIGPDPSYIFNKVLHDQFAVYKFLVDEDGETIIYYAKYFGIKPTSVPRDVFGNTTYDNGLSYSIDFDSAFVEDMNPQILTDFNALSYNHYSNAKYDIDVYNQYTDTVDNRPATAAIITKEVNGENGYHIVGLKGQTFETGRNTNNVSKAAANGPNKFVYKLKWKGDAKV